MELLDLVHRHAAQAGCSTVFLHVITYNHSALRLYDRAGYRSVHALAKQLSGHPQSYSLIIQTLKTTTTVFSYFQYENLSDTRRCCGLLKSFYFINSGRQPDKNQVHYDAKLYALSLQQGPLTPPSPWGAWSLPVPFSSCWGRTDRAYFHPFQSSSWVTASSPNYCASMWGSR